MGTGTRAAGRAHGGRKALLKGVIGPDYFKTSLATAKSLILQGVKGVLKPALGNKDRRRPKKHVTGVTN